MTARILARRAIVPALCVAVVAAWIGGVWSQSPTTPPPAPNVDAAPAPIVNTNPGVQVEPPQAPTSAPPPPAAIANTQIPEYAPAPVIPSSQGAPPRLTVDDVLTQLAAVRSEKTKLDRQEQELVAVLQRLLKQQQERINQLGLAGRAHE